MFRRYDDTIFALVAAFVLPFTCAGDGGDLA
jgi:hypothetical protein